ncbi:PfkB family carbohydrate kinase [Kitasatospora sp. NPDC101155]|uniref:PfkB family carbohydrate kinase n=1 Tax=Kitasatospora sp. NPDC101155 TaxID=3364097 RepID=UPI003825EF20
MQAKAERAGGKGVNVARVLHALGREAVVTGFAGGTAGATLRRELATARLPERLLPIAGETRRTVAVVDESVGDTTILLEPGPAVSKPRTGSGCSTISTISTASCPRRRRRCSPAACRWARARTRTANWSGWLSGTGSVEVLGALVT